MKKFIILILALSILLAACGKNENVSETESSVITDESSGEVIMYNEVKLTEEEIYDKIYGSWLGQAAGVCWGFPTEFRYPGVIMPVEDVPSSIDMNHVFSEDDLFVEIPFIDAMVKNGVNCSLEKLGEAFKNTQFGLDHANKIGRENLRAGIPPQESGSYLYNIHCDDIDWQIDSDFVGCIYPAMINEAAARSFVIGHIMNYGDGVYGGVFVAAMHAAAFTAKSVEEIIEAGISVIPEGTLFRNVMEDVKGWYEEGKTWQENWQLLYEKWDKTARCLWYSASNWNIDAKMNAAYILIGLLYGEGDFDESMKISMRCGQDSDCNPSSVGGILGTFYGYEAIDNKYKENFDVKTLKFSNTNYTFEQAVNANYNLALEYLESRDFEKNGIEWTIKYTQATTVPFEQWPDMPAIEVTVDSDGTDIVRLSVRAHDASGIDKIIWDMGEGKSYENISAYRYAETGEYTIKCTVVSNKGNKAEAERKINITSLSIPYDDGKAGEYRNLSKHGIILCNNYSPQGGSGNKDIEIIRDGVSKTSVITGQYDTYNGIMSEHEAHIGYMFYNDFNIDKVVFTEGMNFNDGGWFANGTISLEALINGEWVKINVSADPAYPEGNEQSVFSPNFTSYTFTFESIKCSGIRIIGKAGGSAGFISIAELEVYGVE